MPREAACSLLSLPKLLPLVAGLGGSTVPSAVRMLLFQQCREETIQGNDYYIILKEYGFEKAEQPGGGGTRALVRFPSSSFFNELQEEKHNVTLPQAAPLKQQRSSRKAYAASSTE